MNDATSALPPVTAMRVPEIERLAFLPEFFGERHMLKGEARVFDWAGRLSRYNGGYWHFYRVSNGAFYMAPSALYTRLTIVGNGFNEVLTGDAAGIVFTLFALIHMAETVSATDRDRFIDLYWLLRDYVIEHVEHAKILAAID